MLSTRQPERMQQAAEERQAQEAATREKDERLQQLLDQIKRGDAESYGLVRDNDRDREDEYDRGRERER